MPRALGMPQKAIDCFLWHCCARPTCCLCVDRRPCTPLIRQTALCTSSPACSQATRPALRSVMGASKHIDRHGCLWSYYWTATLRNGARFSLLPPGHNLVCHSTTARCRRRRHSPTRLLNAWQDMLSSSCQGLCDPSYHGRRANLHALSPLPGRPSCLQPLVTTPATCVHAVKRLLCNIASGYLFGPMSCSQLIDYGRCFSDCGIRHAAPAYRRWPSDL